MRFSTPDDAVRALVKTVRALVLLAYLSVFTYPVVGIEATGHYRPPHSFAQTWARGIGLTLVTIAGVLIIYTLAFRRRRLQEAGSKWLLFIGICLLPTPVMFLSTA